MGNGRADGPGGLVFAPGDGPRGDVFVLVLLRGGMDALHVVPPHANPDYYSQRPRLAVPPPNSPGGALDLDGTFGFHPAMAPALDLYRAGRLAVVHACGTPDQTLSHFEASRTLERGESDGRSTPTGWLGRHLLTRPTANASPFRAVALAGSCPAVLTGAGGVNVFRSLADVRLDLPPGWGAEFGQILAGLYGAGSDPAAAAARQTLQLLQNLGRLRETRYRPADGAQYPPARLGADLKLVSQLIKAEVGLEVAVVEHGGWDSHVNQPAGLTRPVTALGAALAAFATDLGDRMKRVTLVAVSEFGRRVRENSGRGTDHGRATAAFVLSGAVAGGRVYGRWPGVHPDQLDAAGNMQVTTDVRDVLAEVMRRRLGHTELGRVFPSYNPGILNLFEAE